MRGATYNASVPKLQFFIGKGGVGKTTISASYAVWFAAHHPRTPTLLISTDPAHSLGDVFETEFSASPREVSVSPNAALHVWEIDAEREFEKFIGRSHEAILRLVETGTFFTRAEIEPLLDVSIPGISEVAALLALADLLERRAYGCIVVDTAPVGHTLRLFQMPDHFVRLLNFLETAASRDEILAQTFAGTHAKTHPILLEWSRSAEDVRGALSSPESRLVLVTTPEGFALEESVRAADALRDSSPPLVIGDIVLNRAIETPGSCTRCRSRARMTTAAGKFLRRHFPNSELMTAADIGSPIIGTEALRAFGEHVFGRKPLRIAEKPPSTPDLRLRKSSWPVLPTPLSLTVGKGGVGKTTVSAAMAYRARHAARKAVTICSTDPAPSLDDVFKQDIGDQPVAVLDDEKFQAMEIDAGARYREWADGLKSRLDDAFTSTTRGVHVDFSFEHRVFSALLDIVPPGMDEIAATFRILDLVSGDSQRVVIDMAPTGHALEVLRMPERILLWTRLLLKTLAPHRTLTLAQDAAVEIAEVGQRVRRLAAVLKDRSQARVYPVMLAEPLPDRETGRLLKALKELRLPLAPLFVNRVLLGEAAVRCPRCALTMRWQRATLSGLKKRHRGELYVIGEYAQPIAGAAALKAFTRELWHVV